MIESLAKSIYSFRKMLSKCKGFRPAY